MSFDLGLADHRALVTGGSRGVGAAVVDALRGAGAQVVATARSAPARRVEGVRFLAADLSTAEGASAVADSVARKRSEEHTSELQSPDHLVCRLLLEKKKNSSFTHPAPALKAVRGCRKPKHHSALTIPAYRRESSSREAADDMQSIRL